MADWQPSTVEYDDAPSLAASAPPTPAPAWQPSSVSYDDEKDSTPKMAGQPSGVPHLSTEGDEQTDTVFGKVPTDPVKAMFKGTFNAVAPYIRDKDPNLSGTQKAVDVVEGGLSGAAQTAAAVPAMAVDAARYGYAGAKNIGNLVAGDPMQWPEHSATAATMKALDYEPKTAAGERIKTAAQIFSPVEVGTVLSKLFGREAAATVPKTTVDQLENIGGHTYEAAKEAGGVLSAADTDAFINAVGEEAKQSGIVKAAHGTTPFEAEAQALESYRGQPMSFDDAMNLDQGYTERINAAINAGNPNLARKLTNIQDSLREAIERPNVGEGFELLNQGKQVWAQKSRMYEAQSLIDNARNNATSPAQALQSSFNRLSQNERRMRGYNGDERDMIEQLGAAPSGKDEALRMGSSRIPQLLAASHNPLVGGALAVGRMATQSLRTNMAFNRAEKLVDLIRTRSELPNLTNYDPRVLNEAGQITPVVPGQKRGGRVQKPHTGKVTPKRVSYPALAARKKP